MKLLSSLSLIAHSNVMRGALERIDTVAASDSSVLLIGETGVGKELIAEYVHRRSPRSEKPLVKVGLSALPPELVESELFGHERGAFTSASSEKKGLFELAHAGTIFLDDIDDFPLPLQAKLLRVLESREVMRVGSTTPIPIDVRLITATKVDLKEMVDRNLFRSDLYYRINVVPLVILPLRERPDDIPLFVHYFLQRYVQGRDVRVKDLPPEIQQETPLELMAKACNRCFVEENMSFDKVVACLETNLLRQALHRTKGNRTQAARLLGLSLSTMRDKLKKYNLDGER